MKVPPKRKGNCLHTSTARHSLSLNESPSEKEGKSRTQSDRCTASTTLNESPSEKEGKSDRTAHRAAHSASLNESPSEKEGKYQGCTAALGRVRAPSMKVPPKRKGNSYPKIARNHAAETGASREPRGGYTQNYTLQPHLPPHNSLAREETMRATRHVPVTYQVLAHTKTPAGCFLSDPARVLTYERGWRGSGKPD